LRRATIFTVRLLIVLLLCAAALDLPLPRRSGHRVRIHLLDRSQSVTLPGPRNSLKLSDADAIVAHDRDEKAAGDTVTWASFGKTLAWESSAVDDSATRLEAALTTVLARQPTEIILYSDGRGDPGDALFLCRQCGVPVHVLPIGPLSVRDVRFRRISAPATARPGEPYVVEVSVESTFDVDCKVALGSDAQSVSLTAGVPTVLKFPRSGDGEIVASIDVADDCAQNNKVTIRVLPESDLPKVLALSRGLRLPGVALTLAEHPSALGAYDAVILDDIDLTREDQGLLADYVKTGGGLLLLGGPKSYGLGNWLHNPLEDLSPLKIHPDLKLAVVLGIDSSGSMTNEYESVVRMLEEARSRFDADDDVLGMTFGGTAKLMEVPALRKERPSGGTSIIAGIVTARRHLEARSAGRKFIVLMTDGETEEKPEEIQKALRELKDIGLIVVTTSMDVPGARNIHIKNWAELYSALRNVSDDMQDLLRQEALPLDLRPHPVTADVPPVVVSWINRTTAKPDAQVLATVGQAPKQDPVLALRPFGQGRVVALATRFDPALARLIRQALDHAIGDRADGLRLSVEPPLVIARGTHPDAEFTTAGVPVLLKQVGADRWEGRLPADLSGTVDVRVGRAHASATLPCPPEFAALGVDRPALERIARETGGRILESTAELQTLPRPEQKTPVSGRTLFLIAALTLVFTELGASIYWKV